MNKYSDRLKERYDYKTLREKYIKLAKAKGASTAITALHNEIGELERHTYDGGYEKERLAVVDKLRSLSREIWTTQFQE